MELQRKKAYQSVEIQPRNLSRYFINIYAFTLISLTYNAHLLMAEETGLIRRLFRHIDHATVVELIRNAESFTLSLHLFFADLFNAYFFALFGDYFQLMCLFILF